MGEEQDRQYRAEGGGVSLGGLAYQLALGLSLPPRVARDSRALLEVIQPAIDLADNLADEAEDRARGRDPAARYPGLPREGLPFMPALAVAAVAAEIAESYPERAAFALGRLAQALAALNEVQGLPLGHRTRSRDIGARFVALVGLPLWLAPASRVPPGVADTIEAWALAYGGTLQTLIDAREQPGDARLRRRFLRARSAATKAWPGFPPFVGGALAVARILPRA